MTMVNENGDVLVDSNGEMEKHQKMEMESDRNTPDPSMHGKMKRLLWHGGSVYDAWFSAASVQVAQVLLTLPTSFAQLGYASGLIFQIFYGAIGCWACYMITWLYVEYRTRREREGHTFKKYIIQGSHLWFEVLDGLLSRNWKYVGLAFNCTYLLFAAVIQIIAGASIIYLLNDHLSKREWTYVCMLTVLIPSYRNYRVWSLSGLLMITYTAWYMTIAALVHGQAPGAKHTGPTSKVLYFTGATNILYTFGGHNVSVEIMHSMWKPAKFKFVYLFATLYVLTLTLPSGITLYWAFGDTLLTHSNSISLLPKTVARDIAIILMLIHQFITVGFIMTPLFFMWEKLLGIHHTKSYPFRVMCRMPVILPIWFFAIAFPFFGPINSAVGALLVTFTVYIIPCSAHMVYFRTAAARMTSVEKLPFLPSWSAVYVVNMFLCVWIVVTGVGWGGWASITNFVQQINTFGVFAKCYQCPPK